MTLKAGSSTTDISPAGSVFLHGYPHVKRMSTGIHDPLLASALMLETDAESAVLIALDLLFLDPPTARRIRKAVAKRLMIQESRVFMSCSHTHSGPVTVDMIASSDDPVVPRADPEYLTGIERGVLAAAVRASESTRPAELAWTTAHADGVGGNRLSPDGVTDPDVGILMLRERDAGPFLALAVIYGMHPTVLHEDSTLVSADFPGFARLHLQETLGGRLDVLYHSAPCGNQSPRRFVQAQTFAEAERLGRKLGAAVADAVDAMAPEAFTDECAIDGGILPMTPVRRLLPSPADAERNLAERRADYERLRADGADHGQVRTAECAVFGAEELVTLARADHDGRIDDQLRTYATLDVQALRIGAVTLIGWPCEIFTDYALELKRRASGPVHVVSLVNGECQGYIVTESAACQGGYEAANGLFTPETGAIMVKKALELAEKMSAHIPAHSHPAAREPEKRRDP